MSNTSLFFCNLDMAPAWYTLAYSNHFIMAHHTMLYPHHGQNDEIVLERE